MYLRKLLAMILSALLVPLLFSFLSKGIIDFYNKLIEDTPISENSELAEKIEKYEEIAVQKEWFESNKPTGKNPANVSDFTFDECTYNDGFVVEGYMISDYKGKSKDVVIPSEYEGRFVIAINRGAFAETDITSVTFPESIIDIENNAFKNCHYLENVSFPDNLRVIDSSAFASCKSLSSVTLGKNILYLGDGAFNGCISLKNVQITGGVKQLSIGQRCFMNCTALEKVVLPDYISVLGEEAFGSCTSLTDFVFTETGKWTGIETNKYVFENCEKLKNIDASKFITIDDRVFNNCKSLETVTLSDELESIGSSAFSNCVSLKNITLPESLTLLDDGAFSGCTALTAINIPSSLSTIDNNAFASSGLTEIFIPSNISVIGGSAFGDCASLKKIEFAEEGEKLELYTYAFRNAPVEELVLSGRILSLGDCSFYNCENLKKVVYKSSGAAFADQKIKSEAFWKTPLEEIHIPETVESIDQTAIPKEATIYCPAGSPAEEWAKTNNVKYVIE